LNIKDGDKVTNIEDIVEFALGDEVLDTTVAVDAFTNPQTINVLKQKLSNLTEEFSITNERTRPSMMLLKKSVGRYLQEC
jgi:hypothetical protein